jgi:hypothetical protein
VAAEYRIKRVLKYDVSAADRDRLLDEIFRARAATTPSWPGRCGSRPTTAARSTRPAWSWARTR